jgi:hypothetical protein
MMNAEVKAIRDGADHQAIATLLGRYPAGRDIAPREPGSVSSPDALLANLPRDPKKRRTQLKRQLTSYCESLRADIEQYDQIRHDGLKAISDSDLLIAYSGDALNACRCSIELKAAHISYDRSMIEALEIALETTPAQQAKQRHGFIRVRANLPPQKAFIVKKWAVAAKKRCQAVQLDDERYLQVDAELPPHQAFIVRKWSEAAAATAPAAESAERATRTLDAPGKIELGRLYEVHREGSRASMGTGQIVVVTRLSPDGQVAWAHDNKPVKYRMNRNKRRVVDHDPRCILTAYVADELRPAPDGTVREC